MSKYSIRDLEKLSGIKAHTIRIWEQRYKILSPLRTETNIRYYDDQSLKFLLKIALLNQNGLKISKIAELSKQEVQEHYDELVEESGRQSPSVNALISATVSLDENYFNEVFVNSIETVGFRKTMVDVIYPFLERLGILWMRGNINPAQEHFTTNLIRQKILVAVDQLDSSKNKESKKVLLFLPEKETHEISLLFTQYLVKLYGLQVLYLGASVPLKALEDVLDSQSIDWVISIFTTQPSTAKLQQYVDDLAALAPKSILYLSGRRMRSIGELPKNVRILSDLDALIKLLNDEPQSADRRNDESLGAEPPMGSH